MDTPLRAVIVDDEPEGISTLETLLRECPRIEVIGTISNTKNAVEQIELLQPDLVFTDIQMPEKNGFEVVNELYIDGCKPAIIFVTAFDEYTIQAIRYAAFDYLLKPVDLTELKHAVSRLCLKQGEKTKDEQIALLREKTLSPNKLKISTTGGFTLINPEEIVYIQADWNYAELFFNPDKHELVTMNIGSMEAMLPAGRFFRISRSIIINIPYLVKVSRKKRLAILQKDGNEYSFKIPLLNIRKLERFLEGG
ncbi:MAG: response regulator [bacterium]